MCILPLLGDQLAEPDDPRRGLSEDRLPIQICVRIAKDIATGLFELHRGGELTLQEMRAAFKLFFILLIPCLAGVCA